MAAETDRELKQRVLEELEYEPQVNASSVGVTAKDGIVAIYGHVTSFLERVLAEDAVRRVRGVRAIANEIDVNLPGDAHVNDDEIAFRASRLFDWDHLLSKANFSIRVQGGKVDVDGETDQLHLKRRAEMLLAQLPGVVAVFNHIRVVPAPQKADIAQKIGAALARQAQGEADAIRIEVRDGDVTLRGKVGSLLEKDSVERAAAHAPGVRHVTSHLVVGD
ncbi:MAG: BON domain-containing protein [Hyphomonas sp.]|uniref:BON domain-containing protein n=1 Tax=Hyphomonas sp. TaxID=87 RepID=UPI003528FDC9